MSELQRGRMNYFKICVVSLMYKKGKMEKILTLLLSSSMNYVDHSKKSGKKYNKLLK